MLRKGEQERAQLKIDLAQKLENERSRRRETEEQMQQLEAQLGEVGIHIDTAFSILIFYSSRRTVHPKVVIAHKSLNDA